MSQPGTRLALIIEDDPDLGVIFSHALREAGFEPEVARSGEKALERLSKEVPDVIVLDLHLPRMDGVEILRQIRADARLSGVPIIVATADPRMAETLLEQVDLVLIKPVSFGQLRDLAARISA